jgi:hypothetical protein
MKRSLSLIFVLMLSIAMLVVFSGLADARGSRSFGGGRSSFSSPSRSSGFSSPSRSTPSRSSGFSAPSKPSPSRSSGFSAPSKPSPSKSSGFHAPSKSPAKPSGISKPSPAPITPKPSRSTADKALSGKVPMAGGTQKTRSGAVSKKAAKTAATTNATNKARGPINYKNDRDRQLATSGRYQTQFSVEPVVRPSYIPMRYGGYDIIFVPGYGYGYYDTYGAYVPYVHPPSSTGRGLLLAILVIVGLVILAIVLARR